MTNEQLEEFLNGLHHTLGETLLSKLGGYTDAEGNHIPCAAADLSVIRQFLKDNNVTGRATENNPLGKLAKHTLPDDFGENVHQLGH